MAVILVNGQHVSLIKRSDNLIITLNFGVLILNIGIATKGW